MDSVRKNANAKINIALKITGKREDGYHELDMIFLELDLCDEIEVRKIPEGISLSCSDDTLPTDEGNLAYRAARLMMQKYGIDGGVDITIKKKIPSQAGLGGGSSDAACVIKCMNELFDLDLPDDELEKTAVLLGADVPFFIRGGLARARGIGDKLEALGAFPKCSILIVKPDAAVSTPWAYRAFDEAGNTDVNIDIESAIAAIKAGSIQKMAGYIGNDLEGPVVRELPVIEEIKENMLEYGASAALMTGSGSAVFGLFEEKETAAACAAAVKKLFSGCLSFITQGIDGIEI